MRDLRPARPDDFEWFYATQRDGNRTAAEAAFGPWVDDERRGFAAAEFRDHPYEIFEPSGARTGYLCLLDEADHVFVDEIGVAAEHRGRGHGTALLEHAIARAEARGVELRLSVLAPNARAIALYERLGFRTTRVEPPRVKMTFARAPRPRCSVYIAQSLDGFIARTDGALDWLSVVERPGEDYGFAAFYATVDVLVMGRATYETALGFPAWPYAGKRVVVLTSQQLAPRAGVDFACGTPAEVLAQIGGGAHVYVDGGATIRAFLRAGAIDAITLSTIPILLGGGIALFGEGSEIRPALASTRAFPSGLVQSHYRL